MPHTLSRAAYADMYGPTVGDRIRLGDTDIIIEVERDLIAERSSVRANALRYGERADGSVSYVDGANISGFVKVADAMAAQGVI